MSISQAIDAPITTRDTISMSGSLSSQNGNAQGTLANILNHPLRFSVKEKILLGGFLICGRRLVNQGWFEFVAGAGKHSSISI